MPTVWTEVEVDVTLDEFDDQDIIDEYDSRNLETKRVHNVDDTIKRLFDAYYLKQPIDGLLRDLFYERLGRIV